MIESQKAPLFAVFALRAICKKRSAKKGQKAPLLREIARSGHIARNDPFSFYCFFVLNSAARFWSAQNTKSGN